MTKHTMVTFRLHRSGLVLLVFCGLIVAVLLFAAGWVSALQYAGRPSARPSVSPVPTVGGAEARPAPPPAPASDPLSLRLGAFMTEEDAKAFVQSLAARKIDAAIIPVTGGTATVYTVLSGRYTTHDAAAAAAVSLEKQGLPAVIVPAE
ncbi:MAG TPA: SPOR domain-containing protein [Thermoanaerobaculia bacterium]|jgi:cell division septation protein DedD|nr:SPOR domain-containing protein [Thermoanaerobaculia bacterium]